MFGIDRSLIIVLVISLISAVAGIVFYRSTMMQPDFISASANIDSSPHSSTNAIKPTTLTFDQIVLNDLQTQPHKLSEWTSPILIVNFWAPWCPPCRREIPDLVDLQETYQDNMQLIGLSFDSQKNVADFNAKYPMNYPLLLVQSEASQINQFFGNNSQALPFTAVLNEQREIVFQHSGEISKEQLETQIKKLSRKSAVQSQ